MIVTPVGQQVAVVLSSPHSGRHYPESLLSQIRLPPAALRPLSDGPIDALLAPACAAGAVLIAATYPRVVIDLNRDACELDPSWLRDPALGTGLRATLKARAGLGVVPTRLLGEPIYRERLCLSEVRRRVAVIYEPYHAQLAVMLRDGCHRFGAMLVLDCHSMPTMAPATRGERAIDVALGDRFSRSCHPHLVEVAERCLAGAGLAVARNRPYAGGHITERHGRPERGCHALQLELRRGLFMDEASHEPHQGFAALQEILAHLVAALSEAVMTLAPAPALRIA